MRILHTMIRVGDLDKSISFYTDVLGMKLLRRNDYPDGKYTLAFVGYSEESEGAVIELTYNWGVERYELGTGYGHVAIQVSDIHATCEAVAAKGGKVTSMPGFKMRSPEFLSMPLRHLLSFRKSTQIAWDWPKITGGAAGRLRCFQSENEMNKHALHIALVAAFVSYLPGAIAAPVNYE